MCVCGECGTEVGRIACYTRSLQSRSRSGLCCVSARGTHRRRRASMASDLPLVELKAALVRELNLTDGPLKRETDDLEKVMSSSTCVART